MTITWRSNDTSVLGDPLTSIPSNFTFPTCPFRKCCYNHSSVNIYIIRLFPSIYIGVLVLYPCNASAIQEGQSKLSVLTEMIIKTYKHDKEYDPITLYFAKLCGRVAPQGT